MPLLSTYRLALLTFLRFVNQVSGSYQIQEPPEFCGGIVADPMGLGKTLTMIALVASDLDVSAEAMGIEDNEDLTSATLVVVPPPRVYFPPGLIPVKG